jgi:hypothetical protein
VNHIYAKEALEATDIVLGTLPVNSILDSVLFDSRASHSFISQSFAQLHALPLESLPTPLVIHSPGSQWQTSMVSHSNQILVEGLVFLASLISLKSSDIDVILGLDWLTEHQALINCTAKSFSAYSSFYPDSLFLIPHFRISTVCSE